MRKSVVLLTLAVAVATLFGALQVFGEAGPRQASAGGTAILDAPANVALVSSTQSWKVVSKGDFPFNRVDVRVATPGGVKKVSDAKFTCQATGETVTGLQKAVPAGSTFEVRSANFAQKCPAASGVNVTLTPRDPANKLTITGALVQNTTLPQVGAISFGKIRQRPQIWKVTFRDPNKGYNRLDLEIGAPAGAGKVRNIVFFCQSSPGGVNGDFKGRLTGVNASPVLPDHEVWSATFREKCTGGTVVYIIPINQRNQVVIKGGRAVNTTRPREASAIFVLKAKSETFKLTSKATFAANRVDVNVGTASAAPKVQSAVFICPNAPKITVLTPKAIIPGANPIAGDPLPNHEVWSADFPDKCVPPSGSVVVILRPVDPSNQLVIKSARVQNTTPPTPTPTPTDTATPTPTPTPLPGGSPCVKGLQNQPYAHRPGTGLWDFWKCTPADLNLDWNRVDIYVINTGASAKVSAVQFDCQDNVQPNGIGSKALGTLKTPPNAPPGQEVWSGEGFIDPKAATPQPKNCTGAVNVAILPAVATNHPIIKEAVFSHVGPPKPTPTPTKAPSNGVCAPDPNTPTNWVCSPNAVVGQFNRVDISVGKAQVDQPTINAAIFVCVGTDEHVFGRFKLQKPNDTGTGFPLSDVWSGEFLLQQCTGDVRVLLSEVNPSNLPVIKKVVFSHVASLKPTPTPTKVAANGLCGRDNIANTWSCIGTPPLVFSRVDIWVGKSTNTPKLSGATFSCIAGGGSAAPVDGVFKGQKVNDSTEFPLAEQWSADFPAGCNAVGVVLQPADPANNPVIKKVFLTPR